MKFNPAAPQDIDTYIADWPPEAQAMLRQMHATILKVVPTATEAIKYGLPTFVLEGRNLVHFGAFKRHVSFFPTSSPIRQFRDKLTPYQTARGTVQFPLGSKLPLGLMRRMVQFRVAEERARQQQKKGR